ncbi:MAG: DNA gyrase subunit A, partial [Planctomycetaceae bacterium]
MGLKAAASRYTEARLTAVAEQLMNELRFQTVDMRPNYDATNHEPCVLPARFPNLLVNGTQGIAVGMATSIPPHNLGEAVRACVYLIDHPQATVAQVMKYIKGPDFPLGGRIVTNRKELRQAYETGRGTVKVRGEWKFDRERRRSVPHRLIVHSVPYTVSTGSLMSDIGELVASRKIPQLLDVNDETDDKQGLRIVLEIKPDTDPETVMSYLYRHTNLEQNFSFNFTCLTPDEHGDVTPRVLNLTELLREFLDFRFITVTRRFEFQLAQLEKRIHILEGFAIVFDGLEKALRIIRSSDGKQDAARKLMRSFPLDEPQTIAILELQLYRISQLEIGRIRDELKEKRAEAKKIRTLLKSKKRLWNVVKKELNEIAQQFPEPRRTAVGNADEITEFDPQAYIVRENTNVVVSREGWMKRVGRLTKIGNTRVREGDAIQQVVPASTLDAFVVFTSDGAAYTLPVDSVPASSGYGDPLSKHVRLGDGVQVVNTTTTDSRFTPPDKKTRRQPTPAPYLLIVTAHGQVMRVAFTNFRQPSTKTGRKFCRLRKGDRVVFVELVDNGTTMFIATQNARILHFKINDVPVLSNPGIGVRGIRLVDGDQVLGAVQLSRPSDCLRVVNSNDKPLSFGQMKYGVTSRGGKGIKTSARNQFQQIVRSIELVDWTEMEDE